MAEDNKNVFFLLTAALAPWVARILPTGCGCTFRIMAQNYMLHVTVEATEKHNKANLLRVTVAAARVGLAENRNAESKGTTFGRAASQHNNTNTQKSLKTSFYY